MRPLSLLLVLLFAPLSAWSQEAILKSGDILRGQFVQERNLQGFTTPLRSTGRFVIAPGQGLIWQAETPFAITTVVTAAGLTQSVNGTETTRLDAARLPFLARLYDMMAGALAGDWRALEHSFHVSRSGNIWSLTAKSQKDIAVAPISTIHARVGRFVEHVEIRKPNGDWDQLDFMEQILNGTPVSASEKALLQK